MMFYAYAAYMLLMNLVTFFLFCSDKKRARKHRWRIPEWILFSFSALGGCIGGYIAMRCFHHKTRHGLFALGVPALVALHVFIAIILLETDVIEIPFRF